MMNNFTNILVEDSKKFDSESLLSAEITSYVNKVNKILPTVVKDVIHLTQKYNLTSRAEIDEIKNASKSGIKYIAKKLQISTDKLEDLWGLLKGLKNHIYLLPQYMSPTEREELELGRLSMNDLTIDLETSSGRNAATKMYMPMIYKIVNQWVGKSKLSKAEIMSAALEGFTLAMNDWDRSKGVPFKTYSGTRVRQSILNEINDHSHSLSGYNDYAFKKGYSADAYSLDGMLTHDEDGDFKQDRLAALGSTEDEYKEFSEEDFKSLYDLLEKKFSQRDCVIFYRFFGLNGYPKVKSKDLAKEFGWSEGNIRNSVINKIIKFLRTNPKSQEILSQLQESYNISIMTGLVGMDKNYVVETLYNDDMFIILEELNKWPTKDLFFMSLNNALSNIKDKKEIEYINHIIKSDFNELDNHFKANKKYIINFLSHMCPTESMNRKTDVSLLEYMVEIQDLYKKYSK